MRGKNIYIVIIFLATTVVLDQAQKHLKKSESKHRSPIYPMKITYYNVYEGQSRA